MLTKLSHDMIRVFIHRACSLKTGWQVVIRVISLEEAREAMTADGAEVRLARSLAQSGGRRNRGLNCCVYDTVSDYRESCD
jgi:hypothetical protein